MATAAINQGDSSSSSENVINGQEKAASVNINTSETAAKDQGSSSGKSENGTSTGDINTSETAANDQGSSKSENGTSDELKIGLSETGAINQGGSSSSENVIKGQEKAASVNINTSETAAKDQGSSSSSSESVIKGQEKAASVNINTSETAAKDQGSSSGRSEIGTSTGDINTSETAANDQGSSKSENGTSDELKIGLLSETGAINQGGSSSSENVIKGQEKAASININTSETAANHQGDSSENGSNRNENVTSANINMRETAANNQGDGTENGSNGNEKVTSVNININETAANNQGSGSSRSENGTSDDINILLLGETGVGKSTFINAFANYLTFEKMPDGDHEDLVCLIPTSFTMYDNNDDERIIEFGEATSQEAFEVGDSATQSTGCYEFLLGDRKVRIIDTPGIGDTRGIKQDNINFENILTFISEFENLHCICILLKPNNARLTVIFDFCIKQLLCHLQKDASKNIVFLFTNSRGTFYRPGDTGPILAKMLKSIESSPPNVKIKYDSSTRYCLDNESFRFLMAVKCGVTFDEDTKREFSMSWDKSVKECQRLMKYIIGYPEEKVLPLLPHRIKDTVSVNRARRMILELSRPLADIIDNISLNLEVLQKHKKQIEENSTDIASLEGKLYIPIIVMKIVKFEEPQTICTALNCSKVKVIEGVQRYVPIKACHEVCYLRNITGDIIGHSGLQHCAAMNRSTGTCNWCGCSYQIHMHKYYGVEEVSDKIIDNTVESRMKAKFEDSKKIKEFLQKSQNLIDEYNNEKAFITKVMAEFACFLRNNAIISYNDAFKKYLEYKIENLKTQNEKGVDNKSTIDGLQQMIKDYEAQITEIDNAMDLAARSLVTSFQELSADYILDKIEQLKGLGFSGQNIVAMQKAQQEGMKGMVMRRATEFKKEPKNKNFVGSLFNAVKNKVYNIVGVTKREDPVITPPNDPQEF